MLVHIYYSLRVLLPSRKLLERKNEVEISFLELTWQGLAFREFSQRLGGSEDEQGKAVRSNVALAENGIKGHQSLDAQSTWQQPHPAQLHLLQTVLAKVSGPGGQGRGIWDPGPSVLTTVNLTLGGVGRISLLVSLAQLCPLTGQNSPIQVRASPAKPRFQTSVWLWRASQWDFHHIHTPPPAWNPLAVESGWIFSNWCTECLTKRWGVY